MDSFFSFFRVRMEHALVRTFQPRRLVVLTDALDVMVLPTCKPRILQEKYKKVTESNNGSPFIAGAERYIWPDKELRRLYKAKEPKGSPTYWQVPKSLRFVYIMSLSQGHVSQSSKEINTSS
jgi:hypothetical protein